MPGGGKISFLSSLYRRKGGERPEGSNVAEASGSRGGGGRGTGGGGSRGTAGVVTRTVDTPAAADTSREKADYSTRRASVSNFRCY